MAFVKVMMLYFIKGILYSVQVDNVDVVPATMHYTLLFRSVLGSP